MHRDAITVRPLSSRTRQEPSVSPMSTCLPVSDPAVVLAVTPAWCRRR